MRVGVLDRSVEPPQEIPVRPRGVGICDRVQDRFVVLVHQHNHPLACLEVQIFQHEREPSRCGQTGVIARYSRSPLNSEQLSFHIVFQTARFSVRPAIETQTQHRVAHRPIPTPVHRQPFKQLLVALEQLLQRVCEQALTETARSRQEIVRPIGDHPSCESGLVHIETTRLAHRAERLHPQRQHPPAPAHNRPAPSGPLFATSPVSAVMSAVYPPRTRTQAQSAPACAGGRYPSGEPRRHPKG